MLGSRHLTKQFWTVTHLAEGFILLVFSRILFWLWCDSTVLFENETIEENKAAKLPMQQLDKY